MFFCRTGIQLPILAHRAEPFLLSPLIRRAFQGYPRQFFWFFFFCESLRKTVNVAYNVLLFGRSNHS
jgi:hypothetical protein